MYKMTTIEQREFIKGMKDCYRGIMPMLGASDYYLMGYAHKVGGLR
jgi:hypothetical protein